MELLGGFSTFYFHIVPLTDPDSRSQVLYYVKICSESCLKFLRNTYEQCTLVEKSYAITVAKRVEIKGNTLIICEIVRYYMELLTSGNVMNRVVIGLYDEKLNLAYHRLSNTIRNKDVLILVLFLSELKILIAFT